MKEKKDPFKTDKPLYNHNIKYDINHLPKDLQDIISELEEYDKEGDLFNYDMKFDILELDAKSYWRNNIITEYDYKMILKKYGGIYD